MIRQKVNYSAAPADSLAVDRHNMEGWRLVAVVYQREPAQYVHYWEKRDGSPTQGR